MASLDWAAIRRAVVVGLAVIGPALVVASLATDDPPAWAVWAFLAVAVCGFLAAGAVAGRARSDIPMIHGMTAAGLTALILLIVGAIRGAIDDGGFNLVAAGFAVLVAANCGVAGALGADWLRRRRTTKRGQPPLGTMSAGESAG